MSLLNDCQLLTSSAAILSGRWLRALPRPRNLLQSGNQLVRFLDAPPGDRRQLYSVIANRCPSRLVQGSSSRVPLLPISYILNNFVLSQNIVLSGGSTMFQHFDQRLKRDLKQLVGRRLEASAIASGSAQKVGTKQMSASLCSSRHNSRLVLTSMSSATSARDMQFGLVAPSLPLS
jgi:hypothetical protein